MNLGLLEFVLNQLLIIKDLPEANLNAKAKNLLHLEKLQEKIENKWTCFINLIFNLILN